MIFLDPTDFSSWGCVATRDAPHMVGVLSQVHCEESKVDQCVLPTLAMTGGLMQLLPEVN